MKKKTLIIIGIVLLAIILSILIIKLFPKDEAMDEDLIPVYDADVVCHLDGEDTFEDEIEKYSLRAYLTVKDNLVTKAILVGVGTDTNIAITKSYMEDYNKISGIKAQVYLKDGKSISQVEYDYETIDLEEVKDELGYLLIDDSIFMKAKSLPVTLEDYKEYELHDYICE